MNKTSRKKGDTVSKTIFVEASDESVKDILRAVGYTGRRAISVTPVESIAISGTFWDEGSRSTYSAYSIVTGRLMPLPKYNPPQFGGPSQAPVVEIPSGIAVIRSSIFRGKSMPPNIFVRPEDFNARMLPGPVELSDAEAEVLVYTKQRKSNYNGMNRQQMASNDLFRYSQWRVERLMNDIMEADAPKAKKAHAATWEAAKESLIARGLLLKSGAITATGRNAVAAAQARVPHCR